MEKREIYLRGIFCAFLLVSFQASGQVSPEAEAAALAGLLCSITATDLPPPVPNGDFHEGDAAPTGWTASPRNHARNWSPFRPKSAQVAKNCSSSRLTRESDVAKWA